MTEFGRKERLTVLGIVIVAFALRLGLTLFLRQQYFFYDAPGSDVVYYQDWAREIATRNFIGEKTFFGLPFYPYFLAILFRLSLGHIEVMRLFHLLLGSLNCLLVYLLARRCFNRKTALLAGILTASNFVLMYYDWLMMPVTLIIAMTLVILLALTDRDHFLYARQWLILGILIGLAVLGDGKFLFFLAASALWLYLEDPRRLRWVVHMCLGAALVLGVCGLRNRIVGGDWVLISAQSGLSLYAGNHSGATGTYLSPDFIRPNHAAQDEDQRIVAEALVKRSLSPGEVSAFWKKKAVQFMTHQPGEYLRLLGKKFILFFRETEYAYDLDLLFMREWKARWEYNPLALIFSMALVGMAVSYRQWKHHPFSVMLIACQLLITLIFFLSVRHRATVLPLLLIFQSAAVFWIFEELKRGRPRALIVSVLWIVFFMLLFRQQRMEAKVIEANFHAKAGSVYLKKNDLENARISFYKALAIHPHDTATIYNLGNVTVMDGDLDAAEGFYLSALKVCAFNIDALFNLAYVHEQKGELDKALDAYQTVLTYQPGMPDVYFRIASVHALQGDCGRAGVFYEKVGELRPELSQNMREYRLQCRAVSDEDL